MFFSPKMDALPYIDPPNDEEYESYALSLIQEEMGRRPPPKPLSPSSSSSTTTTTTRPLRPTGDAFSEPKLAPLSDASSCSLDDHVAALRRAQRNYESERLRHWQLSGTSELEWKQYNDRVLEGTAAGWRSVATHQQRVVDDINHRRQTWQQQVLRPPLRAAEQQYHDLVQKNLQLRSAIREEEEELMLLLLRTGAAPVRSP